MTTVELSLDNRYDVTFDTSRVGPRWLTHVGMKIDAEPLADGRRYAQIELTFDPEPNHWGADRDAPPTPVTLPWVTSQLVLNGPMGTVQCEAAKVEETYRDGTFEVGMTAAVSQFTPAERTDDTNVLERWTVNERYT